MRLGYFTMPVHPMHRNWAETLKEDREAIILADKLGFYDAFMGEHLTDACENITNSMMFNASLIPATKQIKLATGTSNLSHMHPVLIAVHAAMFDHMAEGRFIFGVSPGALTTDAEALGNLSRVLRDRKKMKGKIGAMAMEAKASAYIIGALPAVVMGLVWLTSPEYIALLFTQTLGNVILGASAVWMTIGILVMRKMINFDF